MQRVRRRHRARVADPAHPERSPLLLRAESKERADSKERAQLQKHAARGKCVETRRALMRMDGNLVRLVAAGTRGHFESRDYVFECANGGRMHVAPAEIKAHPDWFKSE